MRIAFYGDSLTSGLPGSSYVSILRQRLPQHTLINQGKGNETVVSLHQRIVRKQLNVAVDMAFLWIGVNEVPWRAWWGQRLVSRVIGQPPARNQDEFISCYQATLDLLCHGAERVVTVPPLLRGENPDNQWNQKLEGIASAIQEITATCERASYLDLRTCFLDRLAGRPVSNYVAKGPLHVVADMLTLRNDDSVTQKAAQRGLYLTLDGLHLNASGAQLVADQFAGVIEEQESLRLQHLPA